VPGHRVRLVPRSGSVSLLKIFNILISSARGNEREANAELRYLLGELGDSQVTTGFTSVSGLTVANTSMDAVEAIHGLRPLLGEKPWQFRYILKLKPIMRVVPAQADAVSDAVSDLATRISIDETFRISVQKRHNDLQSRELIDAAAKRVPRKVNLQNPSRVVLIEILDEVAGISIVSDGDILAVEAEKRRSLNRAREEQTVLRQDA